MMVLLLSACSEPKTESSSGNADDSKTARVMFTTNGGTPPTFTWTVDTGATEKEPNAPTRNGFVFGGWYTDDKFIAKFDFNTPITITDDITLYAKWDVNTSLAGIIGLGTIPQDLSPYNELVRTILAPYKNGAAIVARYVTIAGAGNEDGSAWEHAKVGTDLRTTLRGIVDATENKVYLLLIGSGEYTVGDTLAMKNHVAIVGGWDSNEYWARTADTPTILSGDDTRQVFANSDIDHTALLYGVEITKGKSDEGGGMYNYNSSPVLTNVTFSGNTAKQYGGGMFNERSSPVLTNVTFSGNTATADGGGMVNANSSPVLTNVTFSGNTAQYGGGMYNASSSPTIVNAVFWGNTATTGTEGPQIYSENGGTITFAYSVIDGGSTTNGIVLTKGSGELPRAVVIDPEYTDPSLGALANNGGFVSTHAILGDSSAANIGLYVRRKGKTFYYSTDKITWYTGFGGSGLTGTITLPSDAIDLTATDATRHTRIGRPDAGAYEAR